MKKILAVVLTIAMVATFVPYAVFAADDVDEDQQLQDAANDANQGGHDGVDPNAVQIPKDTTEFKIDYDAFADTGLTPEEIEAMFGGMDIQDNVEVANNTDDGIKLYIDNRLMEFGENDVKPQIVNGRTLVPLRIVSENLGAQVNYEQIDGNDIITVTKGDFLLKLVIDDKTAVVNGEQIMLDVPPMLINDRTMVPFRFIFEQFGMEVDYQEPTEDNPSMVISAY